MVGLYLYPYFRLLISNKMKQNIKKINRREIKLLGRTFVYPPIEGRTFEEVGNKLSKADLKGPTGDDITALLKEAFDNKESILDKERFSDGYKMEDIYSRELREGLYVFNTNIWTNKGLYVVQNPDAVEGDKYSDLDYLEEIKFSKDGSVRFVPVSAYYKEIKRWHKFPVSDSRLVMASFGMGSTETLQKIIDRKKRLSTMQQNSEIISTLEYPRHFKLEDGESLQRKTRISWDSDRHACTFVGKDLEMRDYRLIVGGLCIDLNHKDTYGYYSKIPISYSGYTFGLRKE